jgi:hypothetical protein
MLNNPQTGRADCRSAPHFAPKSASTWSQRWEGKASVRGELFESLLAQFATPYRNRALSFTTEGDTVVVECRSEAQTVRGDTYNLLLRLPLQPGGAAARTRQVHGHRAVRARAGSAGAGVGVRPG